MTKQQYTELRSRLNFEPQTLPLITFYMLDAALLFAVLLLAQQGFEVLGIPLLSVLMFRNFSLMHDGTHGAISRHKFINDLFGTLSGWVSLLPFAAWKEIHLQHHFWSGNIHKDPVMALRTGLPLASPLTQKVVRYAWKTWIPFLAVLQYALFWKLAFQVTFKRKSLKSLLAVTAPLVSWGLLLLGTPGPFVVRLVLPSVFLYLIFVEVVNFPHHLQLPLLEKEEKRPVWQQDETARTCIYPKWFAKYAVLNFNYHAEHHMYPDAPWYTLGTIHETLCAEYGGPKYTDPHFSWTIKNRPRDIMEVITESEQTRKTA